MKKFLLLAMLALLGSGTYAQGRGEDWAVTNWTFGPKIGMNLSNLSMTDIDGDHIDNPLKAGFVVGAFATYHSPSFWGLQFEALYSMQGTGLKFDNNKGNLRMDYLLIPMLWKAYLFTPGFAFNVGPQIGFLVNKKFTDGARPIQSDTKFRTMDLSLSLGASYDFIFGLTVDLRYNIGFVDAVKYVGDFKPKSKNGVLQISAAYNF